MQSSVLFYGGIEDDQYLENSTRISYDAENNVNVDLLASDTRAVFSFSNPGVFVVIAKLW